MIYEASKDDFILAASIALNVAGLDENGISEELKTFIKQISSILYSDSGRKMMYKVAQDLKKGEYDGDYKN